MTHVLCNGCRVHEPVSYVGVFPVCAMCLGQVKEEFVGKWVKA